MIFARMLLCFILAVLTSCNGQISNANKINAGAAKAGTTVSELSNSIWVVFQDKKKNHWFGSNGSGAYCYNGKIVKQYTTKDGLSSNQIRAIQEDESGNLFFDTPDGVTKFDGVKFTSLLPVMSGIDQWKLHSGDLWFKGNGNIAGAYRYDGDTLYQLSFSSFNSKWLNAAYGVYSIYKDRKGNIWFGTLSAGVCRFNGMTLDWIYEKELSILADGRVPAVRYILEDKDGFFWFSNIISRYKIIDTDPQKTGAIEYTKLNGIDLSQQRVNVILPYCNSAVVDNENIWMTNYNEGIWKYDGKRLSDFKIQDGKTNALIVSIYKDNSGMFWVGTDNSGVYTFNGREFEKFKP